MLSIHSFVLCICVYIVSGPARSGEIREKDNWDPRQVGWKLSMSTQSGGLAHSLNVNALA